jgi:transcriptional regulator with XRE-family HTH domain
MHLAKNFSAILSSAMSARGMSPAELSAKSGVGRSSISMYLSGQHTPKNRVLSLICAALECPADFFTKETNAPKKETFALCDTLKNIPNIRVKDAAKLLGKSDQFVRSGIIAGTLPIGTAVKLSSKWTFCIPPARLENYLKGG